jgi:hypothetical protein
MFYLRRKYGLLARRKKEPLKGQSLPLSTRQKKMCAFLAQSAKNQAFRGCAPLRPRLAPGLHGIAPQSLRPLQSFAPQGLIFALNLPALKAPHNRLRTMNRKDEKAGAGTRK